MCAFQKRVGGYCLSLILGIVCMILAGCNPSPDELLKQALQASHQAEEAAAKGDVDRAVAQMERATKALRRLEVRAEKEDAAKQAVGEARLAVLKAQQRTELLQQETERQKRLSSWKVKGYRASRGLVIQSLCTASAFVLDKTAQEGTNALKIVDWDISESARRLAGLVQSVDAQSSTATTNADWQTTASQFRLWATNPPVEANALLAISLYAVGQTDLALAEIEAADEQSLTSTNAIVLHHGLTVLIYALNGWDRLASQEADKLAAFAPASDYPVSGENITLMLHAFLAIEALSNRDLTKADQEIAACVKVSPNSELVVYLTGERMAANGDWEKAAESFEAGAVSAEDKWFAQRLAQRARDLRDGKGSQKRLVLDPKFLYDASVHYFATTARNSGAAQKLESLSKDASAWGERVVKKFSGSKESSASAER